jgi:hypothetical protein|tara:strand:+ start:5819 stop:6199 length:381 start_codon:yes stop_codon:yes gene_type:complete
MSMRDWSDRNVKEPEWLVKLEFALVGMFIAFSVGVAAISLFWPAEASAHPGGLAADGCHNDRKNGGRHCRRASAPSKPRTPPASARGNVYYANCSEARAAGAAPVRRGDPGYASHLDRDNDGIGCE